MLASWPIVFAMDAAANSVEILGKGAYTVSDAKRLSGVSDSKIRRWLTGRSRVHKGTYVYDPPLWKPTLPPIDDGLYLSFRDLIELRMVDRFRQQDVSMPYLRKVVVAAQELVGDDHPFSTSHFKTDGRKLYLEMLTNTHEPRLIEVLSGQHAFHSIISVGLRDVEHRHEHEGPHRGGLLAGCLVALTSDRWRPDPEGPLAAARLSARAPTRPATSRSGGVRTR